MTREHEVCTAQHSSGSTGQIQSETATAGRLCPKMNLRHARTLKVNQNAMVAVEFALDECRGALAIECQECILHNHRMIGICQQSGPCRAREFGFVDRLVRLTLP